MGGYKARLTAPGVFDSPLAVHIDLEDGHMAISANGGEIGVWSLEEIEIRGRDQGFELHVEGDVFHFSTLDDGRFAHEVGLRWAPPRLRQLMAAKLSEAEPSPEVPIRIFRATGGLRSQFRNSLDTDDVGERPATPVEVANPRTRRGRHQRRVKGKHLRPATG